MEDQEINNIDQTQTEKKSFFYKNRRLLIIVGTALLTILVASITIGFIISNSATKTVDNITTPIEVIEETLPITLSFLGIDAYTENSESSIDILLDTQDNPVDYIDIEIEYDPNAVSSVSLQKTNDPTSALSQSLTTVESVGSEGKSLLRLATDTSTVAQKGYGIIASLIIVPKKATTITFTQNTKIISEGISYSITANPLVVNISSQQQNQALQDRLRQQQDLISQ